MGKREIVIPYSPREPQLAIHQMMRDHRFGVVVAHRRMGKTVAALNHIIRDAVENRKEAPRYAYIAPTYGQAKRVAWDYLLKYTEPLGATPNISELRTDFWGRRIQLYGSDNPDSLRGQYFDGVIIDEIADQDPRIWTDIVRPALSDRLGWALFLGTPKGSNHFKDLRDQAEEEEDWGLLEFKASQTHLIPESELHAARREMGQDKYNQEFECSFHAAVEGSYYGALINDLEEKGRLTNIDRDDLTRTFTAWDLGMSDTTAIWVVQVVGQEYRVMDFVENHGQGLDWYVNWLKENKWHTAEHILPHDVEVRELGTGRSRKEMLQEAGLQITVAPRLSVADGIQSVRRILPKCWFNVPKVKQGLDALRNYRRNFDEKRNVFFDTPLHDWASHCFTADTEILTRHGMCQIMNLPQSGEVMTQCGWKKYRNPRITRRNAPLVEVVFKDGHTVRCTPDHKFLTDSGWKSAESLTRGSLIQSTLTRSLSISMVACTAYGRMKRTLREVARSCTEMFGVRRLAQSPMGITSITETQTQRTTRFQTLNALKPESISSSLGSSQVKEKNETFPTLQESVRQSGTDQKRVAFGIKDLPKEPKVGQNGGVSKWPAYGAASYLRELFAKVAINRSSVTRTAKPLTIESVRPIQQREDVWCLTVPEAEHFSLANGAVVHNCSDAFRYFAIGIHEQGDWSKPISVNTRWVV